MTNNHFPQEGSAVAVEADSVVAVEVAAAAEVVGVTTAIKMDILLANVLRCVT